MFQVRSLCGCGFEDTPEATDEDGEERPEDVRLYEAILAAQKHAREATDPLCKEYARVEFGHTLTLYPR